MIARLDGSRPAVRAADKTPSAGTSQTAHKPFTFGCEVKNRGSSLLGIACEVWPDNTLLGHNLDARILSDDCFEAFVSLARDKEIGAVIDQANLTFAV